MNKYNKLTAYFFICGIILLIYQNLKAENTEKDEVFKKMAEKLSTVATDLNKKTVAVYGFEMIGRKDDSYAKYATEKLTHELVESGKLLIIERSKINKVLSEQQLSMTGIVDADMAAKIGKILSVEGVIIGSITVSEDEVELIARIVQSESAVILKSANYTYKTGSSSQNVAVNTIAGKPINNKNALTAGSSKIYLKKDIYSADENIVIEYSGMPGYQHDWITLTESSKPDTDWGNWFYTQGQQSGQYIYNGIKPGTYEIRAYYNWPAGGYVVQKRVRFTVK
jgi:TolB-like protein